MFSIFKYEWKSGWKSLLIWSLVVGTMGIMCIVLFKSMEESIGEMAESFADMGVFSDVFGMNTLSIATMNGYFATEVGTIHALGGSMFAASIATVALSKEEDQHTAEFTYVFPLSRTKIIAMKFVAVICEILCFSIICGLIYEVGFVIVGEGIGSGFLEYMLFQSMMNIEIAAICFVISAFSKKNRVGVGIGVAMLLYAYDIIGRAVPNLKNTLFVTPFSYCNASGIFMGSEKDIVALVLGSAIIIVSIVSSGLIYARRDLAA